MGGEGVGVGSPKRGFTEWRGSELPLTAGLTYSSHLCINQDALGLG